MKLRFILTVLCALLLAAPASLADEGFYEEMPYYLQFTQKTQTERISKEVELRRTYPDTMNDAVDEQLRALIDEMAERNRALPVFSQASEATLDVGAVISRSGTSVLSFLTLAEITVGREQVSVDFAAHVYDIETGEALEAEDLFTQDSGVWALLADEVRRQLTDAFPGWQPDEQALGQLCREESLRHAAFTLGAARLTLTYRADAVYPGKNTLLHVHIPYDRIRGAMTEYARRQTDNSRFRMVALTFDDGPAGAYTGHVLDVLRQYGAHATFFVVGRNVARRHYQVARQQDSLHSVQSHTYTHSYPEELTAQDAFEEKEMLMNELGEAIGVVPTLMRAPGGQENFYIRHEIGYPLIHWSLTSKDSGNTNYNSIARWVIHHAQDGDVVLMHDMNEYCRRYAGKVLEDFSKRGILCVTVEELFMDAGIALEAHKVYYGTHDE